MLFAKLSEKVMCKIQNVQEADSRQKWGPPSETCDGTCGLAQGATLRKSLPCEPEAGVAALRDNPTQVF